MIKVYEFFLKKRRAITFIIAGGLALVADATTLYLCKGVFGFGLVVSVAIAFFVGFCVSFLLQKFWTFQDVSVDRVHTQAFLYFVIAVANFFLTELLMYLLVEVVHVWYMLAKILVAGGIACATFFIYQSYVFKQSPQVSGDKKFESDKN